MNKRQRKSSELFRIIASMLVIAAIITAALYVVIKTSDSGSLGETLKGIFTGKSEVGVIEHEGGELFADLDGSVVAASDKSLQLFSKDGEEIYYCAYSMSSPVINFTDKAAVVYDAGGSELRLLGKGGLILDLSSEEKIISASVNKKGWMVLCTQESGYYGSATVYNASGKAVYKWSSGEGYILSAEVSPDSKSMSVLVLTSTGSRIVFCDLDSVDKKAEFQLDGTVIIDVEYPEKDRVIAVTENGLLFLNKDGEQDGEYDLSDKYIGGYSTDGDGYTVIAYTDYTVGTQGGLVTVSNKGEVLGQIETSDKILSISAAGDKIAVLYSGSLVIYDSSLVVCQTISETDGLLGVILRDNGSYLLTDKYKVSVNG